MSSSTTPTRGSRSRRSPGRVLAALSLLFSVVTAVGVTAADAAHDLASLPGSNFEIDVEANLATDDAAPSYDWIDAAPSIQNDLPSGGSDDAFGQGSKEDSVPPKVVSGSIPPNKSDLKSFGFVMEEAVDDDFLHVFWSRVQDPQGTTNMDFEFNQSGDVDGNGIPERTAGDALVVYELSKGGTVPVLFLFRWLTAADQGTCEATNRYPCWGERTSLSDAGLATGSVNTSVVDSGALGLGTFDPFTFGEASINLDVFFTTSDSCTTFSSVYLKSRSSDSFSSALKDFILPVNSEITNCGSVRIIKTDDAVPAMPLEGATFVLYRDENGNGVYDDADSVDPDPVAVDPGTGLPLTCTTALDGSDAVCQIDNVLFGTYWVVETVVPVNHEPADPVMVTLTEDDEFPVDVGPLVNPRSRGAVKIVKERKHAASGIGLNHPHAGVEFTVAGGPEAVDLTVTTDVNGVACVPDLLLGDYTVTETVPSGYVADGDTIKIVGVTNNDGDCTDGSGAFDTVEFLNIPLTDLLVSVDSQVDGGTYSSISCIGPGDVSVIDVDAITGETGPDDIAGAAVDLAPGTYTCTIVIDP